MPSEVMYAPNVDIGISAVTGGRRLRSHSTVTESISNSFLKKFWKEKKTGDKRLAIIDCEDSSSSSPSPTLFRRNRRGSAQPTSPSNLTVKNDLASRSRSPSPSFLRGLGRRSSTTNEKSHENMIYNHVTHQDYHALEKLLNEHGDIIDINYMRPPGVSALHQACSQGSIKIVKLLVYHGANVHLKTWSELSPLKVAVLSGSYEVAQYLVEVGASSDDIKDGCQVETPSNSPKSKAKRNNSF
eukprot:TCONS_00067262-protein